ncbi:MAG: flagellar assembly peptidoglycan hydrolase FlgJ [Lautropia sp.]|nr:flagellar assembly peptidoglycan hydrolase FlgJ [Lautropia sp.]
MSVLSDNLIRARSAEAAQGLAIDGRTLDGLKTAAPGDREAIREVARQFEALFMQQILKSMRDATMKSGMFEGPGTEVFNGMLDSQLATKATGRPGGLAGMIEQQLLGNPDAVSHPRQAGRQLSAARPFEPQAGFLAGSPGQAAIGGQPQAVDGAGQGRSLADLAELAARSARMKTGKAPVGRLGPVQAAFVEQMWPHARAAQRKTGIPAAWVVAQAALESGWGRRDIRDADGNPSHNLFGIKAGGSWTGRTVASLTTEYEGGVARRSVEQFRRYDSYAEAFADWASLMAASPRYRKVLQARSAREFADGLADGGYATDPAYRQKLLRTIGSMSASMAGRAS